MSKSYRRKKRNKPKLRINLVFSLICLLILCISMGISSISKDYDSQIAYLANKIDSTKEASIELQNKNSSLEVSIKNLNLLIEEIKSNLN